MKKNDYTIYIFCIYLILIIILLLSQQSCNLYYKTLYGGKQTSCPTNDPNYFYKQNGTKPFKR